MCKETGHRPVATPLSAVVTDGFDGATFHRFLAKGLFFGRLGLLVNEGVSAVVVAFIIRGCRLPTEIAVDALIVDVKFSVDVFWIFICRVGHRSPVKAKWNVGRNPSRAMNFLLESSFRATGKAANSEERVMRRPVPA